MQKVPIPPPEPIIPCVTKPAPIAPNPEKPVKQEGVGVQHRAGMILVDKCGAKWDTCPMKEIHIRLDDAFDRELRMEALRRSLSLQKFIKAALAVQLVHPSQKDKS